MIFLVFKFFLVIGGIFFGLKFCFVCLEYMYIKSYFKGNFCNDILKLCIGNNILNFFFWYLLLDYLLIYDDFNNVMNIYEIIWGELCLM